MTPKDESPRPKGVQYATGKSKELLTFPEAAGPKQKQYPVVDASGEESKI